nr:type II/IV secretion system protein [Gemmatimonadota bacterium]
AARLPAAGLSRVGPGEAALLPASIARGWSAVPLAVREGVLEVATHDPFRPGAEAALSAAAQAPIRFLLASPRETGAALDRIYGEGSDALGAGRVKEASASFGNAFGDEPLQGSATELLDQILAAALRERASDVHLEPKKSGLLVRFRVDGALYDAGHVSPETAPSLVSRVKVTASLDIADRVRPQDGRASVPSSGRAIDLRISTLPLGGMGEKVVIRILDAEVSTIGLDRLGFTPAELYRLQRLLSLQEGMVLATGPTGSGKTTTLYSAIRHVQSSESNVVTVEDPIEYRLEGINQVQVNEKAGLTFASALRSILRQDPDVVLVGEIRDAETAGIAIKAGMTGHLVLSTLHTNDAPSALARLADIGVDMGALAGALKGILAQRLVRRLCETCSEPLPLADLPPDQQALLAGRRTDLLRRAVGCASCRGTGYLGRTVVAEVLLADSPVQHAVARRASVAELAELARQGGMTTLWESGLDRVVRGVTSLHELIDTVAAPRTRGPDSQREVDALVTTLLAGSEQPGVSTVAERTRAAPTGERVLLVDEDREARRGLRAELERDGFQVFEAADGEAGAAYAKYLRPDLVISEIVLPRLDGLGLLQAITTGDSAPRVVIHTTQTDTALLDWARELGATAVLAKPAEVGLLTDCLRARPRSAA